MSTLRVDTLVNRVGNGAPNFAYGLTAPSAVFTGNVSIGGTLTYEDVQNVDAVGIITARQGIKVTTGGIEVSSGVVTATSFSGDGSQLTGISSPGGDTGIDFNDTTSCSFGTDAANGRMSLQWDVNSGSLTFKNSSSYNNRNVISVTNNGANFYYATSTASHYRAGAASNGFAITGSCTINGTLGTNGLTDYPEFKIQGQPLRGYIPASFGADGNTTTLKTADHTLHGYNDKGCLIRCAPGCTKIVLPDSTNNAGGGGSTIASGSVFTILNVTGGDITLEQTSPLALIIAGDSTTGNKTLADRGLATIYYYGYNEAIVTGNVS